MGEQPVRYFKGEATDGRLSFRADVRYTRDQVDRYGNPKIRDRIVHTRDELEHALWETVAISHRVMRLWVVEGLKDEASKISDPVPPGERKKPTR